MIAACIGMRSDKVHTCQDYQGIQVSVVIYSSQLSTLSSCDRLALKNDVKIFDNGQYRYIKIRLENCKSV